MCSEGAYDCVSWASRRYNFISLEQSPFIDELYTPGYLDYFYQLDASSRLSALNAQKYTSDGITPKFAYDLYDRLYEMTFVNSVRKNVKLYPGSELLELEELSEILKARFMKNDSDTFIKEFDSVILAMGIETNLPIKFCSILKNCFSGKVNRDYSINVELSGNNKIFMQGMNRNQLGVSEPNISLAAYRNAKIVNSLCGEAIFRVDYPNSGCIDW